MPPNSSFRALDSSVFALPRLPLNDGSVQLLAPLEDLVDVLAGRLGLGETSAPGGPPSPALPFTPTLWLAALAGPRERSGQVPSFDESWEAWQEGLPERSFRLHPSLGLRKRRFRKAFRHLAAARNPDELRRALRRFALRLGPGNDRAVVKQWLRQVVTDDVAAPMLDCCAVARSSGEWKLRARRWWQEDRQMSLQPIWSLVARQAARSEGAADRFETAKLAAMKQLAYGASHEINNPLANIATRAQTLLLGEAQPERRRKLATIYEQAMRAHEMISDLMLFAHPAQPQWGEVDPAEMAERVVAEMQEPFHQLAISARVVRYPEIPRVEADAGMLAEALKCLLQNSLEALATVSGRGRHVRVRIWPADAQQVVIAVEDNGPGIAAAAAEHLFDPFFSGREAGRGLGFGLSKAWTIIDRLHRGRLLVQPRETGAEFQIWLPLLQPVVGRKPGVSSSHQAA